MFDLAFSELLIIGVVALIVVGPERLPKIARTAGQWVGKLNRYVSQVKQDIDRDIRLEELRKMQQEMKDSAQKYEIMANEGMRRVEDTVAEETGQISKVMQAMGSTDGGLTLREYEKIKSEEGVAAPAAAGSEGSQEDGVPAPSGQLVQPPSSQVAQSDANPDAIPDSKPDEAKPQA